MEIEGNGEGIKNGIRVCDLFHNNSCSYGGKGQKPLVYPFYRPEKGIYSLACGVFECGGENVVHLEKNLLLDSEEFFEIFVVFGKARRLCSLEALDFEGKGDYHAKDTRTEAIAISLFCLN